VNAKDAGSDAPIWAKSYPDDVPLHLDYGHETLVDAFARAVRIYAKRPATSFFGKTITWAELGDKVDRFAAVLRDKGVRAGDNVAIVLPNSPQNVIAFWATLSIGACAVQHNPLYTAAELSSPFQAHKARVAVVWNKSVEIIEEVAKDAPLESIITVDLLQAMPLSKRIPLLLPLPPLRKLRAQLSEAAPGHEDFDALVDKASAAKGREAAAEATVGEDDRALMLFTSGTTGKPKGVPLTHANLRANIHQGIAWVPTLREDVRHVMLAALPMFHAYGSTLNLILAPYIGGEIVLLPSPTKELLTDVLAKRELTWVPGVPTIYKTMLDIAEEKKLGLDTIRAAFSGAASMPVAVIERWEKTTGSLITEGYGLSETSPMLTANPADESRRPGYIGVPVPDTEIRIVDPENPGNDRPIGEEGELIARGPQVFSGYLDRPDADADSFYDGWFRTGDVGVMDEDGFIKIVSRIKEMIITGGFNVFPQEVEEVLEQDAAVEKAAVVGVPKDDGSEKVVAAVVLAPGASLDVETLRAHAKKNLTAYKAPKQILAFDELASDQLGKVRRVEVRKDVMEELGISE